MSRHQFREHWLQEARVRLAEEFFVGSNRQLPDTIRVSPGWSKGAKKNSVGWCWKPENSVDGSTHIFISPVLDDPLHILPVLLHEMIHAWDRNESKHAGAFKKTWAEFGFVGKPTSSVPGPELFGRLEKIAEALGEYPHAKLNPSEVVKTQTTRQLLVECSCGCKVRMTRRWLDEVGPPRCGCGGEMELQEK